MSDRYGRIERLGQMCPDIRQLAAELLAPAEPAVARQAVGKHERLDCGRSSLSRGRKNLCPPPATSRMGGGAAGAPCLV